MHGILFHGAGLVEGGTTKILLRVFPKTVIGPIFVEFIHATVMTASAKATSRRFSTRLKGIKLSGRIEGMITGLQRVRPASPEQIIPLGNDA
jgi:hypothetical protein